MAAVLVPPVKGIGRAASALVAACCMIGVGFVVGTIGTIYGTCTPKELAAGCVASTTCDAPMWPMIVAWSVNGFLILGSGPVAWRLGGRRWVWFASPLLAVPLYLAATPVAMAAYFVLCTVS